MSYAAMDLRVGVMEIFAEAQAAHQIGREKGFGRLSKLPGWSRGAGTKACASTIERYEKAAREQAARDRAREAAAKAERKAERAKRGAARRERRARKSSLLCAKCGARSPTHVCR